MRTSLSHRFLGHLYAIKGGSGNSLDKLYENSGQDAGKIWAIRSLADE